MRSIDIQRRFLLLLVLGSISGPSRGVESLSEAGKMAVLEPAGRLSIVDQTAEGGGEDRVVLPDRAATALVEELLSAEVSAFQSLLSTADRARRTRANAVFESILGHLSRIEPESPDIEAQRRRREDLAAVEPPASPGASFSYDGKSLRGLSPVAGTWEVKGGRIVADGSESVAWLRGKKKLPSSGWEIRLEVQGSGEEAGIVLGGSPSRGISCLFRKGGLVLFNTASGKELGKIAGPRRGTIVLRGFDRWILGFREGGKQRIEVELNRDPERGFGILVRGKAAIGGLEVRPRPISAWADRALAALRRGRGDLALPLAQAVEKFGPAVEGDLLVGSSLLFLGKEREGRNRIRRARAAVEQRSETDLLERCLEQAESVGSRVEHQVDEALAPFHALTDLYRHGIETLLQDKKRPGDLAYLLARRLSRLLPGDRPARQLELRAFSRARGENGVISLFDGKSLDGWSLEEGKFQVDPGAGILMAPSDFEPRVAVRRDLPGYPRVLLETDYRSRSVYDVGFVLGGVDSSYRLSLRHVFHEKAVLIRREDGTERLRREMPEVIPAGDGTWRRLAVFVDRNRIVVFLEGKKILTKIFSQPLTGSPGLFVAKNCAAEFRDVRFRIFDDDREYEEFLGRHDLGDEVIIEAEEVLETSRVRGTRREEFLPHAYNGRLLGAGFGTALDHHADYSFETPPWERAELRIRYRRSREDRELSVMVDGLEPAKVLALPGGDVEDFGIATLDLGALGRGDHSIRIAPLARGRLALDRLTIAGHRHEGGTTEDPAFLSSPDFSQFRMRLSPGVDRPEEQESVFSMVEDLRSYLSESLGVVLERPLTVNVISRECWGDPHIGGYATGSHLYVPAETLHRDLATVAHELSHCFDFGQGFVPPWFGEGKSVPVFKDFMANRGKKYRWNALKGIDSRARMGRSSRKQLIREDGRTLLQYWGTPLFPYGEHPLRGAAYDASAFLCTDLQARHGTGYLEAFHALVQRDLASQTYLMPRQKNEVEGRELANSLLVDYLSQAVGEDLRPYFRDWGFHLVPFAEKDQVLTALNPEGELYLTSPGTSRYRPSQGTGLGTREIPEGTTLLGAFPLPLKTSGATLRVRVEGEGVLRVEGREPIPIPPGAGFELDLDIEDESEIADRRLRFELEARNGELLVSRLEAVLR